MPKDVLIGIDAGTSIIKSVAFTTSGKQLAMASMPNRYTSDTDGAAYQSPLQTWDDCASTLKDLAKFVPDLATRTAAVAVTAQGDGTWLVGKTDMPVTDGWLWLDARASKTAEQLSQHPQDYARFERTGTGLNCCQMGTQLAHMKANFPEFLEKAEISLHPKDWLYLKMTGVRATDPSEACFTFGNFRTRNYDDAVIDTLGLTAQRYLLPEIVDGTKTTHPLSAQAAIDTGLLAGTPVSLAFVDVVCNALGAGIYTGQEDVGCTILGSTGMHMKAMQSKNVVLNAESTGYVMLFPAPEMVLQLQSNMAATLNIDWLLKMAADLCANVGHKVRHSELIAYIDDWLAQSKAGNLMYHPYILETGERGPFINANARASFFGLCASHRFPDLVRAVIEGLAMASRDCYVAMGNLPTEVLLSGGAAKSKALRSIIAAALNTPIRCSLREEAGSAGAAMIAAVANGIYDDMLTCSADWTTTLLSDVETPDHTISPTYDVLFAAYRAQRVAAQPIWDQMAHIQEL